MQPVPTALLTRDRELADPIHGRMGFTDLEWRIIDHPLFQRLRFVRQTGVLNRVFHTANHTRFEHSLGTCHVAGMMLDAIAANTARAVRQDRVGEAWKNDHALPLHLLGRGDMLKLIQSARLAALCLDMGKSPLSYAGEPLYPDGRTAASWFGVQTLDGTFEESLGLLRPLHPVMRAYLAAHPDDPVPYELVSGVCLALVLRDLARVDATSQREGVTLPWIEEIYDSTREVPDPRHPDHTKSERIHVSVPVWNDPDIEDVFIAAMAAMMNLDVSGMTSPWVRRWTSFIRDLIAGDPVNADRLDYLPRDGHACGVSYGNVMTDRVYKSMLPVSDGEVVRLGWKRSGVGAIESLMLARWEMYWHVYGHKSNDAAVRMLRAIAHQWEPMEPKLVALPTLERLRDFFEGFGDDAFLSLLAGRLVWHGRKATGSLTDLAHRLQARDLWGCLGTYRDLSLEEGKALAALVQAQADAIGWKGRVFADTVLRGKAASGLQERARILGRDNDGRYRLIFSPDTRWADMTGPLKSLFDAPPPIRVYAASAVPGIGIPSALQKAMDAAFFQLTQNVSSPE